ncbi:hypothetical protein KN1_25690 [Stygiolobus caldivivus]|uniref:Uncharacterized protein n=1 Tax=Stygiolobus caldivivus TaxID=2824673 RepID=A0A8D5U986_9CREN|nr:hypothetical protein KN1_25690 [Stygiolobus caldivivus]
MLVSGGFKGFGSHLILFELFGSLSKIDIKAIYDAVN